MLAFLVSSVKPVQDVQLVTNRQLKKYLHLPMGFPYANDMVFLWQKELLVITSRIVPNLIAFTSKGRKIILERDLSITSIGADASRNLLFITCSKPSNRRDYQMGMFSIENKSLTNILDLNKQACHRTFIATGVNRVSMRVFVACGRKLISFDYYGRSLRTIDAGRMMTALDVSGQLLFYNINTAVYMVDLQENGPKIKLMSGKTGMVLRLVYCGGKLYISQSSQFNKHQSGLLDIKTKNYTNLFKKRFLFAPMGEC